MRIFLGVSGASGAIYAGHALRALTGAGCEVGLCVSEAGAHVISHEILRQGPRPPADPALVVRRFVDAYATGPGTVAALGLHDLAAPFASGSSGARAALIAPCSSATLGTVAHGTARNLIHRAADVMLKERRPLVLLHREAPLSLVHIENMAAVTRAGGIVLPGSPGFYGMPDTIEDLVDHVIARALDLMGVANDLSVRWGVDDAAVPGAGA